MGINISLWGPQAERFMTSRLFEAGLVCMSEHRQPPDKTNQMKKQLARGNWQCAVSPAVPGMGLGFSAGTLIAWRSTWQGRALSLGSLPEKQGRACFMELQLTGTTVLVASLYLWVGVGPNGVNLELLADVAKVLQGVGKPFCVFCGLEP